MMRVLVTGGAGFIGSNLVEALLDDKRVLSVRVLDNLATGLFKNIEPFLSYPNFEWMDGDIRNHETCLKAAKGMDVICHQAALGSVPRSIQDPLTTNEVNITGSLNIFHAALACQIKKIVYAASSSTYGDSKVLPKVEENIGRPLSPYAVTKLVNEIYAEVFHKTYGLNTIGLRYFNVFGPKQNPAGPYAAVIPLFAKAVLSSQSPFINGDGLQSRDFTFVANAVQANIKAIFCENESSWNQIYNIACGEQNTIIDLFNRLKLLANQPNLNALHRDSRLGDVRDSLADITKARKGLNYEPQIKINEGLAITLDWYKKHPDYFG